MAEKLNLHSPLQRRIARHTNLATLFRPPAAAPGAVLGAAPAASPSPAEPSSDGFTPEPDGPPDVVPVKARLLPPESQLPQAILLPRLPVVSESPVPWEEPQAPSAPTTLPGTIQTAVQPAVSRPPEPGARPAMAPAVPYQAAPDEEDPTWRRLQAIYRRHQERHQAEQVPGESSIQAETSPGYQPPAPTGSEPLTAAPSSPMPSSEKLDHQSTPLPAAPGGPSELPIQRQPAAEPTPPGESPTSRTQAQDKSPAVVPEGTPDETQAAEPARKLPLEAVWPVQRAVPSAPATRSVAPSEPERPVSSPPAPSAQALTGPPTPAAARPGEPEPPGWNLEHLQRARSDQPSASSIEVIPPRRPHPMRPTQASPESSVTAAAAVPEQEPWPGRESHTSPEPAPGQQASVERKNQIQTQTEPHKPTAPAPESGPRQPDSPRQIQTEIGPLPEDLWRLLGEEPPLAEGDTAPTPAAGTAQRTPAEAAEALVTGTAPAIASDSAETPAGGTPPVPVTEISSEARPVYGANRRPLEQHLLSTSQEAAMPGDQGGGKSVDQVGAMPVDQAAALQRAIAAAESKPSVPEHPIVQPPAAHPTGPTPVKDVLPPIQRRAEPGPATLASPSASSPKTSAGQQTENELDLDDLARQVYSQLRRRLELDAERLHRRG